MANLTEQMVQNLIDQPYPNLTDTQGGSVTSPATIEFVGARVTEDEESPGTAVVTPGLQLITKRIAYTDLLPHGDDGYRFAPVCTLNAGDVFIVSGVATTIAFDDTGLGETSMQVVDESNSQDFLGNPIPKSISPLTVLGMANLFAPSETWNAFSQAWANGSPYSGPPSPGLATETVVVGVTDNGAMNGDGAAGEVFVMVLIGRGG